MQSLYVAMRPEVLSSWVGGMSGHCSLILLDLDSTVSAIAFAYTKAIWGDGRPLIPLINVPSPRILQMRGEVLHVLASVGIDLGDLVLAEAALDMAAVGTEDGRPSPLDLVLVDHNEVAARWHRRHPSLTPNVLAIIDHHTDAGHHRHASPRVIETCGSTCSLLVEHFWHDPRLAARLAHLAPMLLRTIIFDTVNLHWRQTDRDLRAVQWLLSPTGTATVDRGAAATASIMAELEEALAAAPESSFAIDELLYKDYKLYALDEHFYYGMSTLHLAFAQMFDTGSAEAFSAWADRVRRFMEGEQLGLLLMINAVRERGASTHTQQLAIFARDPHLLAQLEAHLQTHGCGLRAIRRDPTAAIYDQDNVCMSRKQLHPLCRDFLATLLSAPAAQ